MDVGAYMRQSIEMQEDKQRTREIIDFMGRMSERALADLPKQDTSGLPKRQAPVPLTAWEMVACYECPITGGGGSMWTREVRMPDGSIFIEREATPSWGRHVPPARRWYDPIRGVEPIREHEGPPWHHGPEPRDPTVPNPINGGPVRRIQPGGGFGGPRPPGRR